MKQLQRHLGRFLVSMLAVSTLGSPVAVAHPNFNFDFDWLPSSEIVWNLGMRFGWDFDTGEHLFGFEASYVLHDAVAHGPVFGFDFWRGDSRWQFGYEVVSELTLGIQAGPIIFFDSTGGAFGWHTALFGGAVIVPYYQWTHVNGENFHEAGGYLKLPVIAGYRRDDPYD